MDCQIPLDKINEAFEKASRDDGRKKRIKPDN